MEMPVRPTNLQGKLSNRVPRTYIKISKKTLLIHSNKRRWHGNSSNCKTKQQREEGREGETENQALLWPLGVFKVRGDVGSQVGEAEHGLGADARGERIPDPEHWQQSRARS